MMSEDGDRGMEEGGATRVLDALLVRSEPGSLHLIAGRRWLAVRAADVVAIEPTGLLSDVDASVALPVRLELEHDAAIREVAPPVSYGGRLSRMAG